MRLAFRSVVSFSVSVLLLCGCDAPTPMLQVPGAQPRHSLDNDYLIPASHGLAVARDAITVGDGPNHQQVLFINYDGVTITVATNDGSAASDDATQNKSWIPTSNGFKSPGNTVSVPAFDATPYVGTTWSTAQQVKDAITQHVVDWYAPYNVYVVTARPSSGRYSMMVVGGQTTQVIGSGSATADAVGVAGLDCGNDNQNNIGYAFSASEPPMGTSEAARQVALLLVAQTIAHEGGHTFGLEHVVPANMNATDIMEAAVDPNVTGFVMGSQTLTSPPSQCDGTGTEDTSGRLTTNLGPAPTGPAVPGPVVTWLAPKENATVPRTFIGAVSASQPMGQGGTVTKIDIVQAGVTDAEMTTPPYQVMFSAPSTLPDGSAVRFTAIAYNSLGGKSSVSTDFTVTSSATQGAIPCLISADCQTGQMCTSGACVDIPGTCNPPCASGQACQSDGTCAAAGSGDMGNAMMSSMVPVGMSCTDSSTCGTNGVCASAGNTMYCTQACEPTDPSSCPADYRCVAVGTDHYCGPKAHGCEMSSPGAGSSPLAAAWLVFAVAAALARRRLRPSAT